MESQIDITKMKAADFIKELPQWYSSLMPSDKVTTMYSLLISAFQNLYPIVTG